MIILDNLCQLLLQIESEKDRKIRIRVYLHWSAHKSEETTNLSKTTIEDFFINQFMQAVLVSVPAEGGYGGGDETSME